jgi:hypothetical protein
VDGNSIILSLPRTGFLEACEMESAYGGLSELHALRLAPRAEKATKKPLYGGQILEAVVASQ